MMEVTFLGQAGLMFEKDGFRIMVDPYLSDSVGKKNPDCLRRVPVDESFFLKRPDVMIFTHSHLDHYDPETAERFFSLYSGMTVLSPSSVWQEARKHRCGNHVLFDAGTSWTERGVRFTAVTAVHSDIHAIGVIIDDGDRKYYVTGDTLYSEKIFFEIPEDIYALFLPVNGVGNNMNMCDAARFAARVGAEKTVPIHTGLFDSIDPGELDCLGKTVPVIYRKIDI